MANAKTTNSPLLGYNTNVRHAGHLFHIQTEDSGRDHPHVITHLFTSGTILATKKTPYENMLGAQDWEDQVRQLMKDQHKSMFVELRDGAHDEIASQILGITLSEEDHDEALAAEDEAPAAVTSSQVQVIRPAEMLDRSGSGKATAGAAPAASSVTKGRSIFETPDTDGQFGESLISDKSLDEVILDYLKDDLD